MRSGLIDGDIYFESAGAGPDLVLLHGGGLDSTMWDAEFEALSADYRVTRFDARMHGRSTAPHGDYRAYEDLAAVLREVGAERPILAGLSLGGRTSIDFALAYPEVPAALVLISTGVSGMAFTDPFTLDCLRMQGEAAANGDAEAFVEGLLRAWVDGPRRAAGDVPSDLRTRCAQMVRGMVRLYGSSNGTMLELGAVDRLAELRPPVLTVVGALDTTDIRRESDRLASHGAEQVVIDGAAHVVNLDRPADFMAALRGFLAKI
jgi:3-oxoadipate enol-lactonase